MSLLRPLPLSEVSDLFLRDSLQSISDAFATVEASLGSASDTTALTQAVAAGTSALTSLTARVVPLEALLTQVTQSFQAREMRFHTPVTGATRGSTYTAIARYTTVPDATDYADAESTALYGAKYTIKKKGFYWVYVGGGGGPTTQTIGISKNATSLTTTVSVLTDVTQCLATVEVTTPRTGSCAALVFCAVGDILRPHGDANADGIFTRCQFLLRPILLET